MTSNSRRPRAAVWRFDQGAFWRAIDGRMEIEDLTLRQAARACGLPVSTFWNAKSRRVAMVTVVRVCQWLRTPVDSFVVKDSEAR